jgi:prevent-host-death family protein
MTVQTLDSNNARARWRDIIDAARAGDDTVIARYGKPMAAVIPYADYEALLDELDDLRAGRRAREAEEAWERDPSAAQKTLARYIHRIVSTQSIVPRTK